MNEFRKHIWAVALFMPCSGLANDGIRSLPKYPPQKIEIKDLTKGLVDTIAKGLEGAQRNKAADKIDVKRCYDSGHANGALFFATQIPDFDWNELETRINQKLREKKSSAYTDYGQMMSELVSDWQRCTK